MLIPTADLGPAPPPLAVAPDESPLAAQNSRPANLSRILQRAKNLPKVVWDQQISDGLREGRDVSNPAAKSTKPDRPGSIADRYEDLLATLDDGPRRGLVHRLSVGYYEGWRPSREEVANIIARETGRITESEYLEGRRNHAPSSTSWANHVMGR